MHAVRQAHRLVRLGGVANVPRGQGRAKAERTGREQHVLHRRIDRRAGGAARVRAVLQAGDDPDRGFVVMVGQVFHRTVLTKVFFLSDARGRLAGQVAGSDPLVEGALVDNLHRLLHRRVLDHEETPDLRVAAVRRTDAGLEDLVDHRIRHRIRLQPAHGAHGGHDLEDVVAHCVAPVRRIGAALFRLARLCAESAADGECGGTGG